MQRRISVKAIACLLAATFICCLLGGCWDSRGLDKVSIVTGIAVDKSKESDSGYLISFEVIDITNSVEDNQMSSILLEAEGDTIYDAVSKVEKKLINPMYFGKMQVLVISHQIAESEGVIGILEGFFRDEEPRETINIIISQQKTAKEIIEPDEEVNMIISYEIKKTIDDDKKMTNASKSEQIYVAYNDFHHGSGDFVLPAVRCVDTEYKKEINGLAVIKDDKLVGYLSAEDTKYFLFAINSIDGGILSFPQKAGEDKAKDVSLFVSKSKTHQSYAYANGSMTFYLDVEASTFLGELKNQTDILEKPQYDQLQARASDVLSERITEKIHRVQDEMGADIYGFGTMVYRSDPVLWEQLHNNWDEVFRNATIVVRSDVKLTNIGFVKKY